MANYPNEIDWDKVPDEELEETVWERIEGLKEMFPRRLVNGVANTIEWSKWLTTSSFWLTKNVVWVSATTFMIMAMPYMIEREYADTQKRTAEQQKQVLLGPSSAVASAKAAH